MNKIVETIEQEVTFLCTRYDRKGRRVDALAPDGRRLKNLVVVEASCYKLIGEFKKTLVILPERKGLSPKDTVTLFSKYSEREGAILTIRPHWAYGSKNLVFNIYPPTADTRITDFTKVPLGRKCLVNLIIQEKTYPDKSKQIIIDAYICGGQTIEAEYIFDYSEYPNSLAERSLLIPGINRFFRLWKYKKSHRPSPCLHEDQILKQ